MSPFSSAGCGDQARWTTPRARGEALGALCSWVFTSAGSSEGGLERLQCGVRVVGGPGLESDDTGVADPLQRSGDSWVVDLAGSRFAAAGHVRDLDLPDV